MLSFELLWHFAHQILNELSGKSLETGIPFIDRLRNNLFGAYEFLNSNYGLLLTRAPEVDLNLKY